jgi:hypothetical protein
MATMHGRFVIHHLNASGKAVHVQEQYLLNVNTVGSDSRPDFNDVVAKLSSNGKLRGTTIQVASYAALDHDHDNALNILT